MGILAFFRIGPSAAIGQPEDAPPKGVQVCTLKVEGMACRACASKVEKAALRIEGVKSAGVDVRKGIARITYDPARTAPQAIARTITDESGFSAQVSGGQ